MFLRGRTSLSDPLFCLFWKGAAQDHDPVATFVTALADIYSVSNPQLTIVDGFLCQEGRGPAGGDIVKLDLILGGYDGVAVDTLVCNVINMDPQNVTYLTKLEQKGFGSTDLSKFQIKGEKIEDIKHPFKIMRRFWVDLPFPKKFSEYLSGMRGYAVT